MDFDKLCQEIMNLNPKIRYASIYNNNGEQKYGQRDESTDLLTPEENKQSISQSLAIWTLRKSLSSKLGRGKYAMAEYEKVKRITIPLENNNLLLITVEVEADHTNIINQILDVIKNYS